MVVAEEEQVTGGLADGEGGRVVHVKEGDVGRNDMEIGSRHGEDDAGEGKRGARVRGRWRTRVNKVVMARYGWHGDGGMKTHDGEVGSGGKGEL